MALGRPLFTGFDDFFEPHPWLREPIIRDVMIPQRDPFLVRSSPGFQIHSTDSSFTLAVDVPGVQASDMNVNLEENGRILHLSGGRKIVKDNEMQETKFSKRFTIGDDIDTSQISANLNAGVLTITAPKKAKEEPKAITIPITENAPALAEDAAKKD